MSEEPEIAPPEVDALESEREEGLPPPLHQDEAPVMGEDVEIWRCTPDSWTDPEGRTEATEAPIQKVIGGNRWSSAGKQVPRLCRPSASVVLSPGPYKHFRVTHDYPDPGKWIHIRSDGSARPWVEGNPVGGSQTMYLEWGARHIFSGIDFHHDDQAILLTENPFSDRWGEGNPHPGFEDIHFANCNVLGSFDFTTMVGPSVKWGFRAYGLGRSTQNDMPGFSFVRGRVTGIKKEHAFYFSTQQGDIVFDRVFIQGCGRTGFQFTARNSEGGTSHGNTYIRDCIVRDTCLEAQGGGSAITIKGNHRGTFFLDNVNVEQGGNPMIHPEVQKNITGCLVAHKGGDAEGPKPDLLIGRNSRFVMGKHFKGEGSARRPCVDLSNLRRLKVSKTKITAFPGAREALVLDADTIDHIDMDNSNDVLGTVVIKKDGVAHVFKDPQFRGDGYIAAMNFLYSNPTEAP